MARVSRDARAVPGAQQDRERGELRRANRARAAVEVARQPGVLPRPAPSLAVEALALALVPAALAVDGARVAASLVAVASRERAALCPLETRLPPASRVPRM